MRQELVSRAFEGTCPSEAMLEASLDRLDAAARLDIGPGSGRGAT